MLKIATLLLISALEAGYHPLITAPELGYKKTRYLHINLLCPIQVVKGYRQAASLKVHIQNEALGFTV